MSDYLHSSSHEQEYAYIMNGTLDSICCEQQHAYRMKISGMVNIIKYFITGFCYRLLRILLYEMNIKFYKPNIIIKWLQICFIFWRYQSRLSVRKQTDLI